MKKKQKNEWSGQSHHEQEKKKKKRTENSNDQEEKELGGGVTHLGFLISSCSFNFILSELRSYEKEKRNKKKREKKRGEKNIILNPIFEIGLWDFFKMSNCGFESCRVI